ncbi:MAG TPA: hypothetical protein VNB54_07235 [Alphaproteobacteria bacterium]|nr:hypothetical protein [Alphaproteobacteria bacterium]
MSTNPDPPLLREVARLFAQRVGDYCLSAGIAGVFGVTLVVAMSLYMLSSNPPGQWDPVVLWKSMGEGKQFVFIFGSIFAIWTPILLGARAVCRITSAQLANQELGLPAIVMDMLRFLPSALLYALVMGVPVMMGFSCLFIPALLIASLFTLVVPVSVNETVGILPALRRNFSLVRKVFGGLFLITFLCAIVIGGVVALRIATMDRWLPSAGAASLLLRYAFPYVPALLLMVLANVGFTLIYFAARRLENPMPSPAYPQAGAGG